MKTQNLIRSRCRKADSLLTGLPSCPSEVFFMQETRHLYYVWSAMIKRCSNPNDKGFKNYGGRGITVCEEWKKSKIFMEWAISKDWKRGLILDRIDNNGDYNPNNCRFTDRRTSALNRRMFKNNKTGHKNIEKRNDRDLYRVRFRVNGKQINVGHFKTINEAIKARDKFKHYE